MTELRAAIVLPLLLAILLPAHACIADSLLIRNALIVDGSAGAGFPGDVRVVDQKISAIGALPLLPGEQVVDAGGLVLAPGFIDTHSHADNDITDQRDALAAVSQGITTVVVGLDGGSPFPLADFISAVEAGGTAINLASYVGHNTIRSQVLGEDYQRTATRDEIQKMQDVLLTEFNNGAIGMSTGLEYDPGIYSDTQEVLQLARTIAAAGGRYISHMRSEDRWLHEALDEIIEIGRETGMPVQISHFKLAMKSLWHTAPDIIAKLNSARAAGINITADVYPYEFWQSNMMVLLPERDPLDFDAIQFALDELAPADGIWLTRYKPQPELVGRKLTEIADLMEVDAATAYSQLAARSVAYTAATGEAGDAIIGTSMIEEDIHTLLAWEHSNVCTDGGLDDLHPRARGSFPRVLGRYVREQGIFSLEVAVHKMTALAAEHMGMHNRGLIRPGYVADLVLFDPALIIDRATPEHPERLASGIKGVWVAGNLVYDNGKSTGSRPGKFLRRQAAE